MLTAILRGAWVDIVFGLACLAAEIYFIIKKNSFRN